MVNERDEVTDPVRRTNVHAGGPDCKKPAFGEDVYALLGLG